MTSAAPPLCSCVLAFSDSPEVRSIFKGAAARLTHQQPHTSLLPYPLPRVGDQELIWFEWTQWHPQLRVLPLPEEWYCPGDYKVNVSRATAQLADGLEWRTSYCPPQRACRGNYRCKAVHNPNAIAPT